uniref:DDE-1 domain-containing protein n=1 Tax=Meloidogyne incognita TaxID=6306 RepID=A0A914LH27_MELIC
MFVRRLRMKKHFGNKIYGCDETSVWLDTGGNSVHGEKETTPKGNVKAPSMLVYLSWIAEAWENLSEEMIANSFKICGISNNVDGSE